MTKKKVDLIIPSLLKIKVEVMRSATEFPRACSHERQNCFSLLLILAFTFSLNVI